MCPGIFNLNSYGLFHDNTPVAKSSMPSVTTNYAIPYELAGYSRIIAINVFAYDLSNK